ENTQQGVLEDGFSRITCRGQQVYQFIGIGSFCEYTVVTQHNLTKIHPDAPLDKVCLLGCGVATGYGAALNTGKVEAGSSCAVFGLGAVGLAAVMGCKAAGASRIIGIDINPDKREIGKTFGVTEFVNPKEHSKPIQEVLMEMTRGGLDYCFECVGNVAVMDILLGRTLKGTYFGGWKSVDSVPRLVEDYMSGRIMLDEFVTHTLSLEQTNQALDLLVSGKSIRTVIKM
ncbi:hypothetical protein NFI96_026351, partial [Prochilodus magdalenae]